MADYDGSIRINTQIDTEDMATGLSTITSGLKEFQTSSASLLSITPTVNAKDATNAISSLKESTSKLTKSTGDISLAVNDESASTKLSEVEHSVTNLDNSDPIVIPMVDTSEAKTATKDLASQVNESATLSSKSVSKGLGNVSTKVATVAAGLKSLALTIGLTFGAAAIINFGKECVNVASDLNEVQNVVDTTFGKSENKIESFASTSAEKFGLSTLAAKQYTGTIGAMFKSMGFTTDAAADMSTKIAGLSGDLASFYNLSTDEAFEKLRSGISGETEPLTLAA